jgi:hypothetical protein
MRKATRISLYRWLPVVVLAIGGAASLGCDNRRAVGSGTGAAGSGGRGGAGAGGTAGVAAACAGASDARLVVASQRIMRLTANETLNTVRYLVGDLEARALVGEGIISFEDSFWTFPPLPESDISSGSFVQVDRVADHVARYVLENFESVTGCPTATDGCARAYLARLAPRAYRRQLTRDEQSRFAALYDRLRTPQTVSGYEVTFTVEEATSHAVNALLISPQMLWRWELGDPAMASTAPAGVPLTDLELASQLAFFLTDQPPDDSLLAAASAGTLRANLAAHVETLLASQTARDWLREIIERYFGISRLPDVPIDPAKFPIFTPSLVADMGIEARMFLDHALWNGDLTDLLLSRTAFLNPSLATTIYAVPVPAGATATKFVETMLPPDQRSGLLTNAALLASHGRSSGQGLVIPRGRFVALALMCTPIRAPGHDMIPVDTLVRPPGPQTAQQEVASRAAQPSCNPCHELFDPYGLALDNYDTLGRYRTIDDLGQPVDAHTTLPAAIGGDTVANGVELAQKLATKPAFTNCMARALLQYAVADANTSVEVPLPPQQAGCATADVVQRYQSAGGKTFTDLVRATAAAPAFALRRVAP